MAGIGQAIMQACRPRALQCPLQVGLGVQLHSQYSCFNLVESIHSMYSVVLSRQLASMKSVLLLSMELMCPMLKDRSFNMLLTM